MKPRCEWYVNDIQCPALADVEIKVALELQLSGEVVHQRYRFCNQHLADFTEATSDIEAGFSQAFLGDEE